jgi:hypothetical protein
MSPVATLRYGSMIAPWDAPVSAGVQAFIEYNDLVMNDRHQSDRIRVTKITGLDDADVSDSRDVIPGDDGETAYDAYYRGRTFVMSGRIEAGSLQALSTLERDLKAAWAPLVEAPMKFRWFDIFDSFDDPATIQNYTAEIGSAYAQSLVPVDGVLRVQTTQPVLLARTADNRLWADKQVELLITAGWTSPSDSSVISTVVAYRDVNNYVLASVTASAINITVNGGNSSSYLLASVPYSGVDIGQNIWLRGRSEGDLITVELWLEEPTDTTLPTFQTSAWLQGTDADMFGDQILTLCGLMTSVSSTNWAVDDFKVESLSPCDISFNVRKMPNGMSIADSQDSQSKFNRVFQITARASQSFGQASTQSRSIGFTPSPLVSPTLGFTFPITFPFSFPRYISGSAPANTFVTVNNRGTVPVRPIVYIYGAIGGFQLANLQNGMVIEWNALLADGDYLVFDCLNRTLVNSQGANMLAPFSSTSKRWLQLEPGQNDIYLVGSNYSSKTRMFVFWRHGFV